MTKAKTINNIASEISSNPSNIRDSVNGRDARYVGGVASPAVWYWAAKRGDKSALFAEGNRSRKQTAKLLGFRRDHGTGQLRAVIGSANGYYSEVSC